MVERKSKNWIKKTVKHDSMKPLPCNIVKELNSKFDYGIFKNRHNTVDEEVWKSKDRKPTNFFSMKVAEMPHSDLGKQIWMHFAYNAINNKEHRGMYDFDVYISISKIDSMIKWLQELKEKIECR